VSLLTWVGAQLDDPTRVMHATGVATIVSEVVRHLVTGHPTDPATIAAGMGCFAVGGVIDHYQAKK
jgi:hypothetical protein